MSRARTITQKVVVSASRAEGSRALVDARLDAASTGSPTTGTARAGAEFAARDDYFRGIHRRLMDDMKIVQKWQTTKGEGDPAICMKHTKLPSQTAGSYRQGWIDDHWKPLTAYFSKA
jgi:hypothetical protein